jgi:protocatechuate 3,4-dioxygenase beta subunit
MLTIRASTTTKVSASAATRSPMTREDMPSTLSSQASIRAARDIITSRSGPGEKSSLTTQFYFPDEERNRADSLFRRDLVMQVAEAEDALLARFDVILELQ